MPWDDSGNAWLKGTDPTISVVDPDGTPNNILQKDLANSCTVSWSFTGGGSAFLNPSTFTVDLYAESIGPGPERRLGSVSVSGASPGHNYTVTIPIPPNSLLADGEGGLGIPVPPGASGVYKLVAVINNAVGGARDKLAGFAEGPIIEIRNP